MVNKVKDRQHLPVDASVEGFYGEQVGGGQEGNHRHRGELTRGLWWYEGDFGLCGHGDGETDMCRSTIYLREKTSRALQLDWIGGVR